MVKTKWRHIAGHRAAAQRNDSVPGHRRDTAACASRLPGTRRRRIVIRVILALAGASLLAQSPADAVSGSSRTLREPEVRAMWVQRSSLASPASVLSVVETARDNGFNTLIVQVRGRGDAYYASRYEPRAAALAAQPASPDPALVLARAHRAGRSARWMNVN
jgi:uncharacterized lipoprotein YddW (UPF0748 family)